MRKKANAEYIFWAKMITGESLAVPPAFTMKPETPY